jgi:glycosyltransferase involved in cell wall biosynthesis
MGEAATLAILGSYPPPYGGVGMHVLRLMPMLEARGVRCRVYNATSDVGDGERVVPVFRRRRRWLASYLFTAREEAVYLMSDRLAAWAVAGLLTRWRGKRTLIRLRNAAVPDWIISGGWRMRLARYSLRRVSGVVCVSRRLMEAAKSLGVSEDRLHFSPGFLPPSTSELERRGVNREAWKFVDAHEPVIAANGKVDRYAGQDLYGLDMLVELASRLRKDFTRLGIVVCFWDHRPEDEAPLQRLIARAREAGVGDAILFNTQSGPFVPVLARSDVFVRPTNTDGDANSIREALYLGVPCVASDAVERPVGARLFRNRDVGDFESKVRAALVGPRQGHGAGPEIGEAPVPPVLAVGANRPRGLSEEDRARIEGYLELLAGLAGEAKRFPSGRG